MKPPAAVQSLGSPKTLSPMRPVWAELSQKVACRGRNLEVSPEWFHLSGEKALNNYLHTMYNILLTSVEAQCKYSTYIYTFDLLEQ